MGLYSAWLVSVNVVLVALGLEHVIVTTFGFAGSWYWNIAVPAAPVVWVAPPTNTPFAFPSLQVTLIPGTGACV